MATPDGVTVAIGLVVPPGWAWAPEGMTHNGVLRLPGIHIALADMLENQLGVAIGGAAPANFSIPAEVLSDDYDISLGDWLVTGVLTGMTNEQQESVRELAAGIARMHRGEPAVGEPLSILDLWELFQQDLRSRRGAKTGGSFILDVPPDTPAVWGDGRRVLWAEGEGFMINGPQGIGKGTLAQQLALALLGVREDELLGLPVKQVDGAYVLYLAMDRPAQVARSLRRMIGEDDRSLLDAGLVVWQGPLPFNLLKEPRKLLDWATTEFDRRPTHIIVDSYKDIASNLSSEETGFAVNQAAQECLADGIEWLALHHGRKGSVGNAKPNKLDDVYGSTWLTSGLGSVLTLWGKAGDTLVEGLHLKQPAEPVQMMVAHDHQTGTSTALDIQGVVASNPKAKQRRLGILTAFGADGRGLTMAEVKSTAGLVVSDKTLGRDLRDLVDQGKLRVDGAIGTASKYFAASAT
jgi:hypothetical protein